MQVSTIFYQECGKHIHAVVDVDFCQDDTYIRNARKICRNLERLHLTPQLLHYELTNGFPSFSPFDPKDFGGYSFREIVDEIDLSGQLLQDGSTNGFPSLSPFDPKDLGGYSYYEILNEIGFSDLQEIACYCVEDSFIDVYCQFDLMSEEMKELFKETIQILAEEAKSSGKEFTVEG